MSGITLNNVTNAVTCSTYAN